MNKDNVNTAAISIIESTITISKSLHSTMDVNPEVIGKLNDIQKEARVLLGEFATDNTVKELVAQLSGLGSKIGDLPDGAGDIEASLFDLQHLLVTMDVVGNIVRSYMVPRWGKTEQQTDLKEVCYG